jgi:hypothetical protein
MASNPLRSALLDSIINSASLVLVISVIFIIIAAIQNYGNVNVYCLGSYSCDVSSTFLIFIIKLLYVLFWTWILNLICRAGYSSVSWFLLLLPILLVFILLALLMIK